MKYVSLTVAALASAAVISTAVWLGTGLAM